jgi:small-conductance mechanosensitive channel
LVELGESAIGLQARVWIAQPARADFVRIRSEYAQAVKERCDAEGIELPYPYRQLVGDLTVEEPAADGR